jgi:dipeptidyl aminopeptidase/acylaminoacyl peptidase
MMLLFHKNSSEGHGQRRPRFLRFSRIAVFVLVAVLLIFLLGCARERAGEGVRQKPRPQQQTQLSEGRPETADVQKEFTRHLVAFVGGDILPFQIRGCDTCQFLQYSPNGRYLAYIKGGDIWLYDQQTKRSRNLTRTPQVREYDPVWSPDGRRIAFLAGPTSDDDSIGGVVPAVINLDGTNRQQLTENFGSYRSVTWSPDGKRIAYAHPEEIGDTGVVISELDAANRVREGAGSVLCPGEFGLEGVFFISASWSPCRPEEVAVFFTECRDGPTREEILSGRPRKIRQGYAILDLAQKKTRVVYEFRAPFLYGEPAIWHPSGDYLLLRFEPTPTVPPFESRIVDRYGREIVTVPGFVRAVWSPDGKQFAYIDDYDSHKVHIAAFPPPGGKNTVIKTIYYDDTVELIAW